MFELRQRFANIWTEVVSNNQVWLCSLMEDLRTYFWFGFSAWFLYCIVSTYFRSSFFIDSSLDTIFICKYKFGDSWQKLFSDILIIIAAWAQTLYALRVLLKHGLCDHSLHDVFRAVAVAKLMYASNAWWGFSNANDRQKIFAFIRHCIRTGFCSPDLSDFHDLYISLDAKLFNKIFTCPNHILRTLLPPPTAQNYNLTNRPHNRQLPDRISRITDCNFTCQNVVPKYVLTFIFFRPALCFIFVYNCGLTVCNKRICYVMLCYIKLL